MARRRIMVPASEAAGAERIRTTVTIPADVADAVRLYMHDHPAKFQEALLHLARLGAAEEARLSEVRRLAAQREAAVIKRRRAGDAAEWPSESETHDAILGADRA